MRKLVIVAALLLALAGKVCAQGTGITVVPAGGSSSSSPSSQAPIVGTYLANVCGVANTGNCFFTPANLQVANDCNWTNTTTTLNCTAAHFVAGDAGKSLMGAASFAADAQGAGGGQISTTANITIASFVSSTQVTLSVIPANACAANCSIAWASSDDAGATAMDTFMQSASFCPLGILAGGGYLFSDPHWSTNPTNCKAQGVQQGSLGTASLPAGFALEGREGTLPTSFYLNTDFPKTDPCTHKAASGVNSGCWVIPLMGKWTNIFMTGGNQDTAPNMANKNLLTMSIGTLQNFTCTNMGWKTSTIAGINLGTLAQLYQVNNAGCGGIGVQVESNAAYISAFRLISENSSLNALVINGTPANNAPSLTCYWCIFDMPKSGSTSTQIIANSGGTLFLYGGTIQPTNAAGGSNTVITGYKCTGVNGSAYLDGVTFPFTAALTGASNVAVWNAASGCTTSLINSVINVTTATSKAFSDFGSTSGTKLFSLGGNTWVGPAEAVAGMSVNFAPTDNIANLTAFAPSCAMTTGGGTGPACSVLAGSTNEKGFVRMTPGTTPGASGTTTLTLFGTFSGGSATTPACFFDPANSGTGTWNIAADTQYQTPSTTGPVFGWNNTLALTAASTYDVSYICIPR